eukprot:TRINITY_DN2017_c0_g1_i1.p1 TRINITY_DN2017_c0_g1~~TRINITY_DN2017_c0_g1_i1.p1  ORF type:complete len:460 (-),score=75.50 TRINITY_DN2017_c0_g1_i1:63-1442(-)
MSYWSHPNKLYQTSTKEQQLTQNESQKQILYFPFKFPSKVLVLDRINGLGSFSVFDIRDLREFLDDYFTPGSICNLACCSRIWKFICDDDSLWRRFARRKYKGDIDFKYTWKISVIHWHNKSILKDKCLSILSSSAPDMSYCPYWIGMDKELIKSYRQWYRTVINLEHFKNNCPENIARRSAKELTPEKFIEEFEKPGIPVIITDAIDHWPAMKKWTPDQLLKKYGDIKFRTGGGFKMSLSNYFQYLETQTEPVPLYLFDQNFAYNAKEMSTDYQVPVYFSEDLFKIVGEDDRPPYRWILIGPSRSGAPFHTDPRGTSAWNAVIQGSKRWALYPPTVHPPGVGPDDSEYYNAPSPIKWYLEHYPCLTPDARPLECIHKEGEVLFIPSGWWHMVYNLDDLTVAVTHNFASTSNFSRVAQDLLKEKDDFYKDFKLELKSYSPSLYRYFRNMEEQEKDGKVQ